MGLVSSFFRALHSYCLKRQADAAENPVPAGFAWLLVAALLALLVVYGVVGFLGYGRRTEFLSTAELVLTETDKLKKEAERQAEKAREAERLKKLQEQEPPAPKQEKKLELRGEKDFRDKVLNALLVIYSKDAKAYRLFRNTISAIAPSKEDSRYEVLEGVPTLLLSPADVNKSTSWCAGTIARIFAMAYQQANHSYKSRVVLKAPPLPGQESTGDEVGPVASKPFDYEDARRKALAYQIKIMKLSGAAVQELNELQALAQQVKSKSGAGANIPFSSAESVSISFSTSEPVF